MLGLKHTRAVVHVFAEYRLGFVGLAKVPEEMPKPFGRIECDRVVGTKLVAAIVQVATEERLGGGAPVSLVEERGEEIGGPECVAVSGTVVLSVELNRGAEVGFRPVVLTEREIRAADRFADLGLDLGLAFEPAAEP